MDILANICGAIMLISITLFVTSYCIYFVYRLIKNE